MLITVVDRVLSVGPPLSFATKNVAWTERRNIKDYNPIFLDCSQLKYYENNDEGRVYIPPASDIVKCLESGKVIVFILPSKLQLSINNVGVRPLRGLPGLEVTEESGSSIDETSIRQEWEWYFTGNEHEWDLHFKTKKENVGTNDRALRISVTPVVKNTFDRAIAAEVTYGDRKASDRVNWFTGSVYLIPKLENWEYEDLAASIRRYVLSDEEEYTEEQNRPDWVGEYDVPGERDVQSQIKELEKEMGELENSLSEKQGKLENIRENKVLLFGSGRELENLVPKIFTGFGFEVEGETPHEQDGLIKLDEATVVMEISGTKGGISRSKCRQLEEWVENHVYENPDENYFGLLVINPLRETDPEEREDYIPPDVIRYMEDRGHKIIPTPELFDIYCKYLEEEITQNDIYDALTGEGVVLEDLFE